jgi:NAD(P)-dependent dehydrogenase (short-subunit alcohol dehydrogenase family)
LSHITANGQSVVRYIQADVSELSTLRQAFESVATHHGSIKNIIHTAGVVRDATLGAATEQDFEFVFAPKIRGAWNLHCLCEELKLELESFVVMSSIRFVPLISLSRSF